MNKLLVAVFARLMRPETVAWAGAFASLATAVVLPLLAGSALGAHVQSAPVMTVERAEPSTAEQAGDERASDEEEDLKASRYVGTPGIY